MSEYNLAFDDFYYLTPLKYFIKDKTVKTYCLKLSNITWVTFNPIAKQGRWCKGLRNSCFAWVLVALHEHTKLWLDELDAQTNSSTIASRPVAVEGVYEVQYE